MNIAARVINFTLMIAMPFGLAVYLARKYRPEWYLFGVGMVTFLLSQVLHNPFNLWVLKPVLLKLGLGYDQGAVQLLFFGLFYGFSAGIFEEVSRYLGYVLWIKNDRDWRSALMYGAGHGGIESVILGGIVLVAFVQAISLRGIDLATVVEPDRVGLVRAQIDAYWSAPWHLAILGAVERLATIPFHVSAAVLVLQSFQRRSVIWVILAVLWHSLVDAVAVFASQTWNPYTTEGIILVFGFLSLGIILALKPPMDRSGEENAYEPVLVDLEALEVEAAVPGERELEDSRYT